MPRELPASFGRVTSATAVPTATMSLEPLPECRRSFSNEEKEQIGRQLKKYLGPEFISHRAGQGGGGVPYVQGHVVIALANEVFGFDGWNSSVRSVTVDFVEVDSTGRKFNCAVTVVMRVTLRDGTYREDLGFGDAKSSYTKAEALKKAKKEGVTDGLKRCFREFGNVMGNCVYDSQLTKRLQKLPKYESFEKIVPPSEGEEGNVYRLKGNVLKKRDVEDRMNRMGVYTAPGSLACLLTRVVDEGSEDEYGNLEVDDDEMEALL